MTTPTKLFPSEDEHLTEQSALECWIRLATYRDHPHPKGLQRFNWEAAEEIIRHFDSLKSRLRRTFIGVPIYIGHPDDPDFQGRPGHDDTRAYGWVKKLEARDDGLWFFPKWSAAGRELLENAFYRFTSPRWTLKPLGDGVFQPIKLISIGLTNQPNMQCEAIANEKDLQALCEMEGLAGVLGLTPKESTASNLTHKLKTLISDFDEERAHWQQDRASLEERLASYELAANETSAFSAIPLNTTSITTGLTPKRSFNMQEQLLDKVRREMDTSGKDYLSAWSLMKEQMV